MKITPRQKRGLIILSGVVIVLLSIVIAIGLSKRGPLLQNAITKAQQRLKEDYQVDLHIGKYGFSGLTKVVLQDVSLVPMDRDTLIDMRTLAVSPSIWSLLWGEIKIGDLEIEAGKLRFVNQDSISNYDFLFRKKTKDTTSVEKPSEKNFAEWTQRMAKRVFATIPSSLDVQDFEVSYQDSSSIQQIRIPEATIRRGYFETHLFLNEHDAEWVLQGNIDRRKQQLRVEISSKDKNAELPFLKNRYGLKVSFDKVVFDLYPIKPSAKDLLNIEGEMEYHNLVINHRRLSAEDIVIPEIIVKGGFDIASDYVALSQGSTISVEKFAIQPHAKYTRSPKRRIELAVHTGTFAAQDFFNAIPHGLFESLEGIQVEGDIDYNLDFAAELDQTDSVTFHSSINDKTLKVKKWGKARVDSLNFPFVYPAYDNTTFIRDIIVGPQNPNFVPLKDIPYVLKTTVRNTEDPFFYNHNGFEEKAFKLSIATNLKERKFKRGASTISMQFVKNVFLNRKKTMDRKLEEILLVWLMEASDGLSKDRIFEIYLNVIEWGKNVYGISEAANYYFNKKPQELTLGESLFLSSIIPRPKTGLSSFDHTGHLKPWVQRHFRIYGYTMVKVGDLKDTDVPPDYGFYEVLLQPRLRPAAPPYRPSTSDIMRQDTIPPEDYGQMIRDVEIEENIREAILEKSSKKDK